MFDAKQSANSNIQSYAFIFKFILKAWFFGFLIMVMLDLMSCNLSTPISQVDQSTPSAIGLIEPTQSLTTTPTTSIGSGFAIYLLNQEIRPEQLAMLSHLELEEQPLLSMDEIISYKQETHEIQLTGSGYEKIHGLTVPVSGKAFAVCVDGQPIYAGAFWVSYSSLSFDGVIIDITLVSKEKPVLQIQLGYPGPDFFHGEDPRADPAILHALQRAGKLE